MWHLLTLKDSEILIFTQASPLVLAMIIFLRCLQETKLAVDPVSVTLLHELLNLHIYPLRTHDAAESIQQQGSYVAQPVEAVPGQ